MIKQNLIHALSEPDCNQIFDFYLNFRILSGCFLQIIHTSSQLIDFLEMPENLPDMDIKKLVLRYVLSMNLPFELVAFVHTFMQTTSFEYKR